MENTWRNYSEEFKCIVVELSKAKGFLKETAQELGINSRILTRWRVERMVTQVTGASSKIQVSQEKQRILRLIKQAEFERDILIKMIGIFSNRDGKHLDL